jgi:flagellar biosynthesis/type III secretory pathway protein FliH
MSDSNASLFSILFHKAPAFIVWGCVGLVVVFVGMLIWLCTSSSKLKRQIGVLTATLGRLPRDSVQERRNGLTLGRLDVIRTKCAGLKGKPGEWWTRIDEKVEPYISPEDTEGWFLTENPRAALPYDVVVGRSFHAGIFGAFPGLLTAFGLMLTFSAILLALLDVNYNKLNTIEPVTGMETLINGLSGKFLSSICALVLSIVFTIAERVSVRRVKEAYEHMLSTISEVIPFLHTSRILLDIHRFSAKQTVSVSNISAEVVDRFTSAFNDRVVPGLASGMSAGVADKLQLEFRPTMDRMAGTLDGLQNAITQLERDKQQSVTGEFEKMAEALGQSITNALAGMASSFHEALSGSAKQEFGNVQGTLEATRQMLSEMNTQFGSLQTTFSAIITKAEQATTDQLNNGREQTEALSRVMHGLMNKLQDTADQNLSSMQTQLTRVVGDLTEKVTKLSIDMMDAAKDMAGNSQDSAKAIIDKTDAWSEATAKRLESLLGNIEDRSRDFKEASETLLNAKTFMSNLLAQNGNALTQMAEASRNVQVYTNGLVGQSDALKVIGSNNAVVAINLKETAGNIRGILDQNKALLDDYRHAILEYKVVIDSLDVSLGKIMQATTKGLGDYNQSVEKNFTKICDIANEMVPKAANLLNTQIADLEEQLGELGEVISKAVGGANGRSK